MRKYFYITVILCLIIITGSVFYYFVIYPPKLEKERITSLDKCREEYVSSYLKVWDRECKRQGLKEGCKDLPSDVVDAITNAQKQDFNFCIAKYPH